MGNVVYTIEGEGSQEFVFLDTSQSVVFPYGIAAILSPEVNYIASYDIDNPHQLAFFDLSIGMMSIQIPWQREWVGDFLSNFQAHSHWIDNDTFAIPSAANPTETEYYVDRMTGEISGPYAIEDHSVPQYDPKSSVDPFFSPSGRYAVYRRCDQANYVSTPIVIYDTISDQVVTEIDSSVFQDFGPPKDPRLFFGWSPASRYLIYNTIDTQIGIYDLETQAELSLDFLPTNFGRLHFEPGGVGKESKI